MGLIPSDRLSFIIFWLFSPSFSQYVSPNHLNLPPLITPTISGSPNSAQLSLLCFPLQMPSCRVSFQTFFRVFYFQKIYTFYLFFIHLKLRSEKFQTNLLLAYDCTADPLHSAAHLHPSKQPSTAYLVHTYDSLLKVAQFWLMV